MAANCNDSLTTFNKQAVWGEQCVPALRRLVSLFAVMRGYDVHLPDQLGCVPEMEDMDEIFLD